MTSILYYDILPVINKQFYKMFNTYKQQFEKLSKDDFINFKDKDKGVERGFFGVKITEMIDKIKDSDILSLKEQELIFPEFLKENKMFACIISYTLQANIQDDEKKKRLRNILNYKNNEKELFYLYLNKYNYDIEVLYRNLSFENLTNVLNQDFVRTKFKINDTKVVNNKKLKKLIGKIKLNQESVLKPKPEYIIKGDNFLLFNTISVTDYGKGVVRNVFEKHIQDYKGANEDVISEFIALGICKFLGGNSPKNTYFLLDQYNPQKGKVLIASKLHEDFRDFEGYLYDSKTGEKQEKKKNYNRLIPNKSTILKDGKEIKLRNLPVALIILALLNDLDGVGAQGQNIGFNSNGDILFFDFGHSYDSKQNLGTNLMPQLGSGNVKSRNIASFFSGIPLKEQLKALNIILKKFEYRNPNEQSEFDKFLYEISLQLKILEQNEYSSTYFINSNRIINKIKNYMEERIKYIHQVFDNRLKILENDGENGKNIIDILDNLQLLIFKSNLTKYSKNGVVLREGLSYFDITKENNGKYRIILKGKSKYSKASKEYLKKFHKHIHKCFGAKHNNLFSYEELLQFGDFILKQRLKQIKNLKDKEIEEEICKLRKKYNDEITKQNRKKYSNPLEMMSKNSLLLKRAKINTYEKNKHLSRIIKEMKKILKTENTIRTNQGSMFNENEYINLIKKNPEHEIKNNEFASRVKKTLHSRTDNMINSYKI